MTVVLLLVLLLTGCSGPVRKDAVPETLTTRAVVPGLADVRYRLGIDTERLRADAVESFYTEVAYLRSQGHRGQLPPANFLAISGGGDDGAFGAGLLNGWTAAGTRPYFKLVTGVSTGALTAPFTFLGPAYDDQLKRFYTELTPSDIVRKRSVVAALTSDALSDNEPLKRLVAEQVDEAFLAAVAAEHRKGRILLIATTDLDARQSVLWNMTKIAASTDPKAPDLFRAIMIASAAIPAAFPPVMIDVEADGLHYQEMHVDGGTMAQVFVYPPALQVKDISRRHHVKRERRAFVIRNARLDPAWAEVDRRTLTIAERAISSLIQTQGVGDLYRIYLEAKRDGVDFNLAYIPSSFNAPHREDFDPEYMRALFRTEFDMATNGFPWAKAPPGF
jgi:hypothetical protein